MSLLNVFSYIFIVDEEIVYYFIFVVVYVIENLFFMIFDFKKYIYVIVFIWYVSL